jgi:hypothetical protein
LKRSKIFNRLVKLHFKGLTVERVVTNYEECLRWQCGVVALHHLPSSCYHCSVKISDAKTSLCILLNVSLANTRLSDSRSIPDLRDNLSAQLRAVRRQLKKAFVIVEISKLVPFPY